MSALLLALAAGGPTALAACSASPATHPQAEAPRADNTDEQAASNALVPSDTTQPCRTRRLGVRVSRRDAAADGSARAVLILTNTGVNACSLSGWPTVALADGGRQVNPASSTVAEPTSPVGITLSPGSSAFAGLRWTPCTAGTAGCASGGQLLAAAPGSDLVQAELSDFSLAERKQITIKTIVIGSIQPTATGVTGW